MNTSPYTSIKSVLYGLSTILPEQEWNGTKFLEWAYRGLYKLNLEGKYQPVVCMVPVNTHKAELPSELKYLTQIAYLSAKDLSSSDIEFYKNIMNIADEKWNPAIVYMQDSELAEKALQASRPFSTKWKPMRLSSNTMALSLLKDGLSFFPENWVENDCSNCHHEYTVDADRCITTTLKDGLLLVSYLRYPKDRTGDLLIPDDEDLKEAIEHYVLYKYWQSKVFLKEDGAFQLMKDNLSRFEVLRMKLPGKFVSIDALENIKAHKDHLVPRSDRYRGFFSGLNQWEISNDAMDKRFI